MEIGHKIPAPAAAPAPKKTPAPTPAPAPAADPAVLARIQKAAAKQELNEAQARAVLEDSGIPPAEFSKFNVRLDIHKETGRVVVSIQNKRTGELLQKLPSESILRGAVMLKNMIGTILDTPT